jgi:hypothetical protein
MERKEDTIHIKKYLADCLNELTELETKRNFFINNLDNEEPEIDPSVLQKKMKSKIEALFGEEGEYDSAEIQTLPDIEAKISEITETIKALERHIMGVPIKAGMVMGEIENIEGKHADDSHESQFNDAVEQALDELFR